MKKKYIIIFTIILLILCTLSLKYIHNIPPANERFSYAVTDRHGHIDSPRLYNIQIEKKGTISINDRILKPFELKHILKNAFDSYGYDFPVALHVDKNSKISKLKPVVDEILLTGGRNIWFVAQNQYSSLYYFPSTIYIDDFKAKNVIELSHQKILLNYENTDVNKIQEYVNGSSFDGNTKIICSDNVSYQTLIDVLSICRYDIEFIIKENSNK